MDEPVFPRGSARAAKYPGSSSQVLWECNEVVNPNGSGTQIQPAAIFGTRAREHATPMRRTRFLGTQGISDKSRICLGGCCRGSRRLLHGLNHTTSHKCEVSLLLRRVCKKTLPRRHCPPGISARPAQHSSASCVRPREIQSIVIDMSRSQGSEHGGLLLARRRVFEGVREGVGQTPWQ